MANPWARELEDFGTGVKDLFQSRPFWLVTETDVRSRFIEAVLKERSDVQVHDVCTEITLGVCDGKIPKIDLVVKHHQRCTLAIEFKRWQIVAKPTRDLEGTRKSGSNRGALDDQWLSICNDVLKLEPLIKEKPELVCLIVVYTQHELQDDHARDYGGRPSSDAFRLSLHDKIQSGSEFQKHLEKSGIYVGIDDWTPTLEPFHCAAKTQFSLGVFRLCPPRR